MAKATTTPAAKDRISTDFFKQPMSFEPNVGQAPQRQHGAQALFFSRGPGYRVELGAAQARLQIDNSNTKSASNGSAHATAGGTIAFSYVGADPAVAVSGRQMLPGRHNYIPTGDPKTWHSNVPTYGAVEYKHLYPGVDLSFYGNSDRLEYDFTVAPKADASRIKLAIAGAQAVSTDAAGNLVLVSQGKTVRFLKPVAYQTSPGGERRSVDAAYNLSNHGRHSQAEITFTLGDYDHSQSLVIDPVVDYAFYLPQPTETGFAGAGYLYVGASTTDSAGNTYMAGTFPYITHERQNNGFFIAKFNDVGTEIYDTTIGAAKSPYFAGSINGIAVDGSGNVYITGAANSIPIVNGYQTSGGVGFIAVVNPTGSLTYSSYFGTNVGDGVLASGNAIAVDTSGNAYIVGSANVPTTAGAAVPTRLPGGPGYVAKFNPSLSGTASLIYSTYLGGASGGAYLANGVTVDSAGDAYVTGNTVDAYPTTPGAYTYNGRQPNNDVFVTKVNPTGTAFLYSALLGPGSGQAIVLDSSNDAYVTGSVYEDDYPTTSGAYQTSYPSGFVTELNPAGSALVYSTFLGGPNDHLASGSSYIAPTNLVIPPGCSSACTVYVGGHTNGGDLPLVDPIQSYVPGSAWSGFYMQLAGDGSSLLQSSYIASGSGFDPYQQVLGIGVDSSANIYIAGDVLPALFPVTQPVTGNTGEAFLARIIPAAGAKLAVTPPSITFTAQVEGVSTAQQGIGNPTVTLHNLGSTAVTLSSIKVSSSVFSQTNNCNGTVPAAGSCTLTLSYTPTAAATQTGTITFSSNATLNPTLQLSGTGKSDRYLVATCGGTTACAGLSYPDEVIGNGSPAQVLTVTNLGNTSVALTSIVSSLPDYNVQTNCPLTGNGLARNKTCQISVAFHPIQVGLRAGTITIASSGSTSNTLTIPVAGTGLLSPNPSSLVLLGSMLNFGTATVGASSGTQTVTVFNNGTAPATVFTPTTSTTGDASGVSDYIVTANTCGAVLPEGSCTVTLSFAPTATSTRSGKLTIPTSASSTALTSDLTGIGVATKQTLEFDPVAITLPDQVIDTSSTAPPASVYNVGPTPVYIDRVFVSGSYQLTADSCSQTTLTAAPLSGQGYASCSFQVQFSPTSTGMKSGTVTVVDSEGNQTPVSLAGTGIAQNGMLYIGQSKIDFGSEPVGTTSRLAALLTTNIGNSPITLNAITVTGDYSYTTNPSFTTPIVVRPTETLGIFTNFTPSKVASPDNGMITLTTSAGNYTVNLTGVGVAATKAIILSPPTSASFNFGSVEVGKTTVKGDIYAHYVTVYNPGTDPVTFTAAPAIGGTDASDFGLSSDSCNNSNVLKAGGTCSINVYFSPSASGTRTATLTLTDNATTGNGTQTLTLSGTGTSTQPAYTLGPNTVAFYPQTVNIVSVSYGDGDAISFYNNSSAAITISSVALSPLGIFTQSGSCNSGKTLAANGGVCSFTITFAPTAAGQTSGTATITDSNGHTYAAKLYGYATPIVDSLSVNPLGLNFAPQPQLLPSAVQYINVYNYSTQPATIGQATGKNTVIGLSTTGAFSVANDYCSTKSLSANGSNCYFVVTLSPTTSTAVGNQSGTITIPVTYADNKTSSVSVSLSGSVAAPYNSAALSPSVLTYTDQPANTTSGRQTITLTNKSNEIFTVGTLTSTNTSSSGPFQIFSGNCAGLHVAVGGACTELIDFAPTTAATGVKGTLSFPITFTNGKTETLTATYTGNALAAKSSLLITPDSADFGPEVVGQAYGGQQFNVTNTGNQPVQISAITLSSTQSGTNFTRNGYNYNQCGAGTLLAGATCPIFVEFAPQTTGTINGTLTIGDTSASGGPHTIPLVGVGVAATKTIVVSQSSVNLGDVTVGAAGSQQTVYLTNQSASAVGSFTYTLGGQNASDFTLQNNNCAATIYAKQSCALLVSFNPAKASLGPRTATITVAFGGSTGGIGSPITINLQGTGTPPAPAVALFPTSLSFPTQAVGSKSLSQYFRLYNTGSADLKVTSFGDTTTEFSISSNTCSGSTLTVAAGQSCLIGVAFAPSAAGTRTGSVQFTDNDKNVTGSTQTVALTGAGVAVPLVTLSPSSLAFGNQNLGTTSATETVTVSNPGAATLNISSIALAGSHPGDYLIASKTCGTTLASTATCTVTVQFTPTATGSRTASIVLSDNADTSNGVSQPTQTITLSGTGVGVPSASASPSSLSFGSGTVGTPSAAMTVTLKNSGTGPLAIASIGFTGTNAADFTETNGCGTSLAAGSQCSIAVVFDAKAAGARAATLVVTDNSGLVTGVTQTVGLSATGVQ